MPQRNEQIWRCSCGTSHFVSITYAWDMLNGELYAQDTDVLMVESLERCDTWLEQIKSIWKILKGRDHTWAEVLLDLDSSIQMRDAMNKVLQRHNELKIAQEKKLREGVV